MVITERQGQVGRGAATYFHLLQRLPIWGGYTVCRNQTMENASFPWEMPTIDKSAILQWQFVTICVRSKTILLEYFSTTDISISHLLNIKNKAMMIHGVRFTQFDELWPSFVEIGHQG